MRFRVINPADTCSKTTPLAEQQERFSVVKTCSTKLNKITISANYLMVPYASGKYKLTEVTDFSSRVPRKKTKTRPQKISPEKHVCFFRLQETRFLKQKFNSPKKLIKLRKCKNNTDLLYHLVSAFPRKPFPFFFKF